MKPIICFLMIIFHSGIQAQITDEVQRSIDSLNSCIDLLYAVSPYENKVSTPDTGILFFEPFIQIEGWKMIDSLDQIASKKFERLIKSPGFFQYGYDKKLKCRSISSVDGKIIVFNWFTNNGGTWRIYRNYIVSVSNVKVDYLYLGNAESFLCGGTGSPLEIFQFIKQDGQKIYFIVQFTRGCGGCFEYSVLAIRIKNQKLIAEKIFYKENEATECFSFEIDRSSGNSKPVQFIRKDSRFIFTISFEGENRIEEWKWNGKYFVKK